MDPFVVINQYIHPMTTYPDEATARAQAVRLASDAHGTFENETVYVLRVVAVYQPRRQYDVIDVAAAPQPPPPTEDCCVSSTAGRSLQRVGDAWECDKGHRWRVTTPGRAERVPPF